MNDLDKRLACEGFHRVGRIDSVDRRSLWMLQERGALELRAGREGEDSRVRITSENPQYQEIHAVMAAARFASEFEVEDGFALEESFALDQNPKSIYYSGLCYDWDKYDGEA